MANNKKPTIFQSLERAISGNWNPQDTVTNHINTYDLSAHKGSIFKTTDKDEYETKKLELQQDRYLKDRWVKANVNLNVTAYAGLNNVKLMYRDADLMSSAPEISAALDIYADESTIPFDTGQIVQVQSKSERVKSILEDLFANRLNLNLTSSMIIRAMCKYGNQFMLLDIDHKLGIKGWKQMPVFNVERVENGIQNPYTAASALSAGQIDPQKTDMSTKFIWLDADNAQVPFRDWQIAHFRLVNDSMYLPYGCLVGDTRVETEYGYKEIQHIIPGDKVWTFNTNTQERELGTVTIWQNKGEKDVYTLRTRHNYLSGTQDHKLLCVENNEFVYKEIKDVHKGDFVVISNAIINNASGSTIKIDKSELKENEANFKKTLKWWNSGQFLPDNVDAKFAKFFGFMLGDGWIKDGKIVTFAYGEYDSINNEYAHCLRDYTNKEAHYKKYHSSQSINANYEYNSVFVYSKELATILYRMGFVDGFSNKRIPQWVYCATRDIRQAFLNGLMSADGTYNIDKYGCMRCTLELANEQLAKDAKILAQSLGFKTGKICRRNRVGKNKHSLKNGNVIQTKNETFILNYFESDNTQIKKFDLQKRLTNSFIIEKVEDVVYKGKEYTYDITIDNENSNFFANGIVTHNCSALNGARRHWRQLALMEDMMLIYRLERSMERRVYKINVGAIDDADVKAYVESIANELKRTPIVDPMTGQIDLRKNILSVDNDLFLPTRSENAPTPVDTLPAGNNLTAIDDIKYIQKKVLAALRIPRQFLSFDESTGDGGNLALQDIRFTRTVNRFQQAFLMELTKVATIHLYLLGFIDDLTNFSLTMNNPSTQAEQLKIDTTQKKISAIRDAISDPGGGIPVMSLTRALKTIMGWSEKDIKENLEEIRLEKALAAELEKTVQIITRTGIFDRVDRIYGEPGAEYQDAQGGDPNGDDGMGGGAPMGGGGDFGAGLDDMGAPGGDDTGELAGDEGAMPTGDMDAGGDVGAPDDGGMPMESNRHRGKNLITESFDRMINKYINEQEKKEDKVQRVNIYDSSFMINEDVNTMLDELDKYIDDAK